MKPLVFTFALALCSCASIYPAPKLAPVKQYPPSYYAKFAGASYAPVAPAPDTGLDAVENGYHQQATQGAQLRQINSSLQAINSQLQLANWP